MGKIQVAGAPNSSVTRGGTAYSAPAASLLPDGGYDLGDGTAAKMVYLAGGTTQSVAESLTTNYTSSVGATTVQITSATPAATRFSVVVQNTGGQTLYVGASNVTGPGGGNPGLPISSGQSITLGLGPTVALYANSPSGTSATTLELS